MASSKVMASSSSKPRNSDLTATTTTTSTVSATVRSRRASYSSTTSCATTPFTKDHHHQVAIQKSSPTTSSSSSTMTVDGILRNVYATPLTESTLLDAQITLIDTPPSIPPPPPPIEGSHVTEQEMSEIIPSKTVDEVWREIVAGRKEMKEEQPDDLMTLEAFLEKAGVVDEDDIKMQPPERLSGGVYAFDPPTTFQMLDKVEGAIVGFGNEAEVVGSGGGRGKRGRAAVMEPLDKAAQQRQRRMIKNRESAARSRERKQVSVF